MRRFVGWAALLVGTTVMAACGADIPEDYTAETRENFLVACTDPLADSILITELCECVFESTQSRFTFDRFVQFEDALRSNLEADLNTAMSDVLADCILREADL